MPCCCQSIHVSDADESEVRALAVFLGLVYGHLGPSCRLVRLEANETGRSELLMKKDATNRTKSVMINHVKMCHTH